MTIKKRNPTSVIYRLTKSWTLRGHHGSALSHVNSGIKSLGEVEVTNDGEQRYGVLITSPHPFVDFQELEIMVVKAVDFRIGQGSCLGHRLMSCRWEIHPWTERTRVIPIDA